MENSIQTLAENYISSKSDKDFKVLYNRLMPGIKKYVWNFLKDYDNSNDLSNEVISSAFTKIITKISQYNPAWNFSTWVYRIVRNECLGEINRLNKLVFLSHYKNDDGEDSDIFSIDSVLNKDEYVSYLGIEEREEYEAHLNLYEKAVESINNLNKTHKEILIDRELNNMKYEDIALKYSLPLGTVKSRIHSGRKKVKNEISKFLED